jgi:ABC-type glycerol-3-phosphate transport system substrate-binding protein
LLIYSNSGKAYIQPVLDGFAKAYPGIKLRYTDLEDPVAFARYRAEQAQGARTADIIIASSPSLWDENRKWAMSFRPPARVAWPNGRRVAPAGGCGLPAKLA